MGIYPFSIIIYDRIVSAEIMPVAQLLAFLVYTVHHYNGLNLANQRSYSYDAFYRKLKEANLAMIFIFRNCEMSCYSQ